ncbi:MAG: hypothetical protein M3Q95_15100 [Bacteroidota bacterium]|nr:hypothetical protein [Bacteroidota bacterium]
MKNEELFGVAVTQMYACLIKNEVLLKYPNFFFERGMILYDYDNETYVYSGYSEEEQRILKEAATKILRN